MYDNAQVLYLKKEKPYPVCRIKVLLSIFIKEQMSNSALFYSIL